MDDPRDPEPHRGQFCAHLIRGLDTRIGLVNNVREINKQTPSISEPNVKTFSENPAAPDTTECWVLAAVLSLGSQRGQVSS